MTVTVNIVVMYLNIVVAAKNYHDGVFEVEYISPSKSKHFDGNITVIDCLILVDGRAFLIQISA